MADAIWIEFEAPMGAEQYDQMNDKVNPVGNPPDGLIFHSAGPSPDGGWRIVDIWESKGDFDRFFEQTVQPTMVELLGEEVLAEGAPPQITTWSIHNHSG